MIRYFAVFIFCLCSTISFSQKNKNAGVMSSEQFINNYFKKTPPSKWKPGDQFIYIDSLLNITLTPSKRNYLSNISFRNKIFTFKEFREHTDWGGNTTLNLIFESDSINYIYETGKDLQQISDTLYNPLIPGLISFNEIYKADSLLKNLDLFILSSEWNTKDSLNIKGLKYIEIKIDSVSIGENDNPVRINFSHNNKPYFIDITLSGMLMGSSRYSFSNIFSFTNPKNKYKEIENNIWEQITKSEISIGMTRDEVRLSLGKPSDVKRQPLYSGLKELWIYNNGSKINFMDGVVVGFGLNK